MYRAVASAKSGVGLASRPDFIDDIRRVGVFLCRAYSYISMAGRTGASQGAPVPTKAGSSNLVRFHHP
ncbi:ash family protein [Salmonella enterica subsp. enterica serovar Landwasser]|nr:ash family protein [Salmonella enterica subsp. enterica serovar Landwasser]